MSDSPMKAHHRGNASSNTDRNEFNSLNITKAIKNYSIHTPENSPVPWDFFPACSADISVRTHPQALRCTLVGGGGGGGVAPR